MWKRISEDLYFIQFGDIVFYSAYIRHLHIYKIYQVHYYSKKTNPLVSIGYNQKVFTFKDYESAKEKLELLICNRR
jgi:hypothetical protein